MPEKVVEVAASLLGQAALKMASEGKSIRQSWNCNAAGTSNQTRQDYEAALESTSKTSRYLMQRDKHSIPHLTPNLIMNIRLQNKSTTINVGSWNPTEGIESAPGYALAKVKRFFRVVEFTEFNFDHFPYKVPKKKLPARIAEDPLTFPKKKTYY